MKAYELHPEEGFAALQIVDRPAPSEPGPLDVVVRIGAVSLNYRDLAVARAAKKRAKRIVPVSDGAGEVVAVGERVTRVKVGDRVAAAFFPTWTSGGLTKEHHANALGGSIDGVLAEQCVLPESAWVKVPAHFSFEQASTLPCAGVTAWHALFEAASLRPGDTILVQGTGGVSIFALQLARAAGARVIATSSSAAKRARLEEMGTATTIDYRQEPKWGDAVRAATRRAGRRCRGRGRRRRHLRRERQSASLWRDDEPALVSWPARRVRSTLTPSCRRTSGSTASTSDPWRCSRPWSAPSTRRRSSRSSTACSRLTRRARPTTTWRAARTLARSSSAST